MSRHCPTQPTPVSSPRKTEARGSWIQGQSGMIGIYSKSIKLLGLEKHLCDRFKNRYWKREKKARVLVSPSKCVKIISFHWDLLSNGSRWSPSQEHETANGTARKQRLYNMEKPWNTTLSSAQVWSFWFSRGNERTKCEPALHNLATWLHLRLCKSVQQSFPIPLTLLADTLSPTSLPFSAIKYVSCFPFPSAAWGFLGKPTSESD